MALELLQTKIKELHNQIHKTILIQGISKTILGIIFLSVITFILDYFLILPWLARLVLFLSYISLLGYIIRHTLILPFQVKITDDDLVIALEKANPRLQDRLIAAFQFARLIKDPNYSDSKELSEKVIQDADALLLETDFDIVRSRSVIGYVFLSIFTLGAIFYCYSSIPNFQYLANLWLRRNIFLQSINWPQRTNLFLLKETFVVSGQPPLTIQVKTQAKQPILWYLYDAQGLHVWDRLNFTTIEENTWQTKFPETQKNFYFYLEDGGQIISSLYKVIFSQDTSNNMPQKVSIELPDTKIYKATGQNLYLRIFSKGYIPRTARIVVEFANKQRNESRLLYQDRGFFQYDFTTLIEDFDFFFQGGDDDDEFPQYSVHVLTPPITEAVSIWYQYPSYTQLSNTPLEAPITDGNISAVIGTKVILQIRSNVPLSQAKIVFPGRYENILAPIFMTRKPPLPKLPAGDTIYYTEFTVQHDTRYRIDLTSENRLVDPNPTTFQIRALLDDPPTIIILSPKKREYKMLLQGMLPIVAQTIDDFGIKKIGLKYQIHGQSQDWQQIDWDKTQNIQDYGNKQIESRTIFDLPKILNNPEKLENRQNISLKIYAIDTNTLTPGYKETSVFSIEVLTNAAELNSIIFDRLNSIKQQLVKIIEQQEERKQTLKSLLADQSSLEESDMNRILQLRFAQNAISRDIAQETNNISDIMDTIEYNGLWKDYSEIKQVFKQIELLSREEKASSYQGTASEVEKSFNQALLVFRNDTTEARKNLESAISQEEELITGLKEVVRLLREFEDYNGVIQVMEELLKEHSHFREELQEILKKK